MLEIFHYRLVELETLLLTCLVTHYWEGKRKVACGEGCCEERGMERRFGPVPLN